MMGRAHTSQNCEKKKKHWHLTELHNCRTSGYEDDADGGVVTAMRSSPLLSPLRALSLPLQQQQPRIVPSACFISPIPGNNPHLLQFPSSQAPPNLAVFKPPSLEKDVQAAYATSPVKTE
jgi:hypothetical protein